jgi:hypothetical protein
MEHDGTIPRNPARNFFLLSRFDAAQSSSVDCSPHVVTGAMMCFFFKVLMFDDTNIYQQHVAAMWLLKFCCVLN